MSCICRSFTDDDSLSLYFICVCAAVNFICENPAIKAISFVGSNQAGEYIYEHGSKHGKRVQSNMVRHRAHLISPYKSTLPT